MGLHCGLAGIGSPSTVSIATRHRVLALCMQYKVPAYYLGTHLGTSILCIYTYVSRYLLTQANMYIFTLPGYVPTPHDFNLHHRPASRKEDRLGAADCAVPVAHPSTGGPVSCLVPGAGRKALVRDLHRIIVALYVVISTSKCVCTCVRAWPCLIRSLSTCPSRPYFALPN